MNEISVLKYNNQSIRQTETEDGEILFCARDVANALGYKDTRDLSRNLDEAPQNLRPLETDGGLQNAVFYTEAELYEVLIKSRNKRCKPLRRWITHEVLPSIRKYGCYVAPGSLIPTANQALVFINNRAQEEIVRLTEENEVLRKDAESSIKRKERQHQRDEAKKEWTIYFLDPRTGKDSSRRVTPEVKALIDKRFPDKCGRKKREVGKLVAKYETRPKTLSKWLKDKLSKPVLK